MNGTAMFNHGSVRPPLGLNHCLHYSIEAQEYNSNFSFNLPWWDRLFGSCREQPAAGHIHIRIGLRAYSGQICSDLIWMVVLPFKPLQAGSDATPRGHENDED